MPENTSSGRLEGRVASILNARELVINLGSVNGVLKGQRFAVMAESPVRITDPQSGVVLDSIDREKIRVEASEVRPRISICRTYRLPDKGGFSALATTSTWRYVFDPSAPEELQAFESQLPPPLSEEERYVKINDRVVAVDD